MALKSCQDPPNRVIGLGYESSFACSMNHEEKHARITELVRTRLPALVLFARQWNHDAAEDMVQDAFVKLLRHETWPERPIAWLMTVIRNASNNQARSRKREQYRQQLAFSMKDSFADSSFPETDELIRELERLDREHREIIVAKIWGELSFEEIAVLCDSSRSSVHRKYKEGLLLLPYIGAGALYESIRLDEPWDSEHNR